MNRKRAILESNKSNCIVIIILPIDVIQPLRVIHMHSMVLRLIGLCFDGAERKTLCLILMFRLPNVFKCTSVIYFHILQEEHSLLTGPQIVL